MKTSSLFLAVLLGRCVASAAEPVQSKHTLTLEGARQVLAAAETYARKHHAPGAAVAVVDDGGHLLAFARLEGTFVGSPNISIGKARTSALFRKPTSDFEELINKGRFTMTALSDFTPLQGGVPILHEGHVVGAIGVSGASSATQDEEIAKAGAQAVAVLTAVRQ
jgi:glc operon protein GlcG